MRKFLTVLAILAMTLCSTSVAQMKGDRYGDLFMETPLINQVLHHDNSAVAGFSITFSPPTGSSVQPGDMITAVLSGLPDCEHFSFDFNMSWTYEHADGSRTFGGYQLFQQLMGVWSAGFTIPDLPPGDEIVVRCCLWCMDSSPPVEMCATAVYKVT